MFSLINGFVDGDVVGLVEVGVVLGVVEVVGDYDVGVVVMYFVGE